LITSTDWIQALGLIPHPEGGYYREFYRSSHVLSESSLPEGFRGERDLGSVIHYMLTKNDFSAFHRLRSDEIWHFHHGSAFLIHIISPEGDYRRLKLGLDVHVGEVPCIAIPAGSFFGAEVAEENSYALASCTVMPGFSFEDFQMPSRDKLLAKFPKLFSEIMHLTRETV
jgi:predicted cupin superfamily sugar epimerase